jgi:hypothetical protein
MVVGDDLIKGRKQAESAPLRDAGVGLAARRLHEPPRDGIVAADQLDALARGRS